MKKLVVLFSILTILCWVPSAFAIEAVGDWDGEAAQGQLMDQSQGGNVILGDDGAQIGGIMGQESEMLQEYKAGGIAVATVDPCVDCEEPGLSLGGGLAVSGMGAYLEQGQHEGQAQVGVFGQISLDKTSTMTSTHTRSGEENETKNETKDKSKTETKDKETTETEVKNKTVNEDSTSASSGEFALNKEFNADGSVDHTTTDTQASDETSDTTTHSDTWTADGHVDGALGGSGSHESAETWDKSVDESKDKSKVETETKTKVESETKTKDVHKDWTQTCTSTYTKEKSLLIQGNGVAGAQYGGGSQSGHLGGFAFSAAHGGGIEYQPITRPDQVIVLP